MPGQHKTFDSILNALFRNTKVIFCLSVPKNNESILRSIKFSVKSHHSKLITSKTKLWKLLGLFEGLFQASTEAEKLHTYLIRH